MPLYEVQKIKKAKENTMPNIFYALDEVDKNEREDFLEDWDDYMGDWE